MSSWGEDIAQYKASKGKVPWKPDQQKKVSHVTKYQRSREERAYDPIQGQFRDVKLEKQYAKEEREVARTAIQKANDHALQYTQTFNIVNHNPNIKASKLNRNVKKSGKNCKSKVPATRVGYNIVSNKGFSVHHHAPPSERPTDTESDTAPKRDAPGSQKLDFDIISNKYSNSHDDKEALDKLASQQLAADRYWKTHNFNPVEGKFYDQGKEAKFQTMLKRSEKVQGKEQQASQPRSIKYSEGAMYDLISNATKDNGKLKEISAIGDRCLKSKKRHQIEANLRQQSLNNDTMQAQRTMNRMARAKGVNSGFNPVTNAAAISSPSGGPSRQASAWDRISTGRAR